MIAIVTVKSVTNQEIDVFPIEVDVFNAATVAEEIMLMNTGLTSEIPKSWDLMLSCMKTPLLETINKIVFNMNVITYTIIPA